ncbi:MAG: ABC transporter permease [Armatimonadota bacterium]|nr:ABC transporter permease [Armatimonadota bacterium]MDR7518188.1 ABC transporter permease [Armatimonadota bacterium]MDR7548442.1 ABC transporter permease [Armatimonadota bacterium]
MSARVRLGLLQVFAPLIAILVGALVAAGIILALGQNPLEVYAIMVRFSLMRIDSLAAIWFKATPLLFSGLAVALSFRASVWNIGVEGQYYVGAFAAAWVGFSIGGLPAAVHLPLAVLAGAAAGALWAFVPIALKLRRGAHEVITTIMMNYIAGALVLYLLADVFRDPTQAGTPRVRTPLFHDSARMPLLGPLLQRLGLEIPEHSALNWFLVVGVVMCAGAAYVLARSRFGYEVRAVALNPGAAEAAGISLDRVRFVMFMTAGAVAGLVGLSDILGFFGYFDIDFPKGLGFAGISVALLARNHPLGIIPAAWLFGFLDRGAQGVQVFAGVPREVITILQAVIILAIVVAYELLTRYVRVQRKREAERASGGSPIAAVAEGG